ncbi:MAG: hypothetical protein SFV15_23720 [Polyangiaceae bacterium]|nr:hypothetical protein [Polyangiaceae bacterium]
MHFASRSSRNTLWRRLGVILALAVAGCTRKAPSIEQCEQIAVRLVGVNSAGLRLPQVRAKVEEVAFECLTQPYDQELYRCLLSSIDNQACVAEFRQRARPTQQE